MRLEDVFGRFGLENVQFTAQSEEVGVEMAVGHDLPQIVVIVSLFAHLHEVLLTTWKGERVKLAEGDCFLVNDGQGKRKD